MTLPIGPISSTPGAFGKGFGKAFFTIVPGTPRFTQLAPYAVPMAVYGEFAGKAATVAAFKAAFARVNVLIGGGTA